MTWIVEYHWLYILFMITVLFLLLNYLNITLLSNCSHILYPPHRFNLSNVCVPTSRTFFLTKIRCVPITWLITGTRWPCAARRARGALGNFRNTISSTQFLFALSLSGCFSPFCPGCEVEWCTFVSIFSMSSDIRNVSLARVANGLTAQMHLHSPPTSYQSLIKPLWIVLQENKVWIWWI